jgi:3-hydroxyisobutyrate dehydrogenase
MASRPSVGFIGLGSQGGPMARRIVDDEFPLTVWARRAETLDPFVDTAATTAASPAALAEACEIVCVCVTGDADVEEVVLGPHGALGALEPGAILVIHSTVHPQTCVRLSEIAAEKDVALLDAPVSGGGHAATQRALLVMVGGNQGILERVRPVLATFGDPILHLGQVGAGQTAKLVNNFAFTAQISLVLEVFTFVDQLGVDREAMARVLERGSGGSRAASILSGSAFDLSGLGEVAGPLLRKDFGLMADIARSQNVDVPDSLLRLAERSLATLNSAHADPV